MTCRGQAEIAIVTVATQGLRKNRTVAPLLSLRKVLSPWSVFAVHVLSPDGLFCFVQCPVACGVLALGYFL